MRYTSRSSASMRGSKSDASPRTKESSALDEAARGRHRHHRPRRQYAGTLAYGVRARRGGAGGGGGSRGTHADPHEPPSLRRVPGGDRSAGYGGRGDGGGRGAPGPLGAGGEGLSRSLWRSLRPSLAPPAVVAAAMPRSIRTGQPPNPVPCLLLGQLATDSSHTGRGIGTGLLKHALTRCVAGAPG